MIELEELSEEELKSYIDTTLADDEDYQKGKNHISRIEQLRMVIKQEQVYRRKLELLEEALKIQSYDSLELCEKAMRSLKQLNIYSERLSQHIGISHKNAILSDNVEKSEGSIDFKYEEGGILCITLPYRLPKKENVHYFAGIQPNIYLSFQKCLEKEFSNGKFRIHDKRAAIVITSIYRQRSNNILDYDNMIIKPYIDAISMYMLVDDSPDYYSLHMNFRFSEENDYTEIRVMPITTFLEWIKEQ